MALLLSKTFFHHFNQGFCCSYKRIWNGLAKGLASTVGFPSLGNYIQISREVTEALQTGKGVVALESTIITHGMPYPHNLSTALSVENLVRKSGSIPATVAVIGGKLRIGLSELELQLLAEKSSELIKVSRRDLSYVLGHKLSGGTTVSGTMIAAHMAGIRVFATGGIGGVHRGAESSFDVSADLTELGRTPVAVVSSGVKSILDIPKTLEYLETQGVFVSSFGDSRHFPAFFTPNSGSLAPYNTHTVYEAAQIINTQLKVGLSSGLLFAVPIPDKFSACGETIEKAINVAVSEAQQQNVSGKSVTPFILDKVNKLTGGESLQANIALVENNARIAGGIARCLSLIQQEFSQEDILADPFVQICSLPSSQNSDADSSVSPSLPRDLKNDAGHEEALIGRPIVIGASISDVVVQVTVKDFQKCMVIEMRPMAYRITIGLLMSGATYPGKVTLSSGGVGRNLADCLTRMEANPVFVSVVGNDSHADRLSNDCPHMDLSAVQKLEFGSTANYSAILSSSGHLLFGVGDMEINTMFDVKQVPFLASILEQAPMVILDSNFSSQVISHVVNLCHESNIPVWFEPTDVHKAAKPFESEAWKKISLISPNFAEFRVMWRALRDKLRQQPNINDAHGNLESMSHLINESLTMCRDLAEFIPVIVLTLGHHGALLCHTYPNSHVGLEDLKQKPENPSFKALYFPAVTNEMEEPVIANVSGAGDCLNSAIIAGLLKGKSLNDCLKLGMLAANLSLHSKSAIPDCINPISVSQEVAEGLGWVDGLDVSHGWESFDVQGRNS